jgi:hypothetical protein
MQGESGNGNGNGQGKKGKGKGKGKGKAGNHGSPVRDLSGSRQATDPWDDWHNAWVVENSQSTKGGGQGTHQNQNQNQNQNQKQKRSKQHQNNNNNNHRQQSGSAPAQNRRGRGGHVHPGQKRKATEGVTNSDDGDRQHAPKRHKSEKRPTPGEPNANADSPDAHPDFWYPDGSVIIQVENTKFRLHRTKLQKQSAYFAAAFGEKEGQKRGGRAYLEVEVDERNPNDRHIPVYRVTETTANDFATLLTAIEGTTWMCVLSLIGVLFPLPAPLPVG